MSKEDVQEVISAVESIVRMTPGTLIEIKISALATLVEEIERLNALAGPSGASLHELETINDNLVAENEQLSSFSHTLVDGKDQAEALLELLESDFGQSGKDVRLEAIKCQLDFAYQRGLEHANKYKKKVNPHCLQNGILCAPSGDGKCVACDDNNGAID